MVRGIAARRNRLQRQRQEKLGRFELLGRLRRLPPLARAGIVAAGLAIAGGCGTGVTADSRAKDLFTEDQSSTRRHKATADEAMWAIDMNGCTGHLVSPDYMMSANHCQPRAGVRYTSGAAMAQGQQDDITVTSVEEASATLDYAIMRIRWANGTMPKEQRFPALIATKASDVKMSTAHGGGDDVFTTGFPGDKTDATYSEGHLKQAGSGHLFYDMGIINGNSGGGVWRKSDHMLVSLTNGGQMVLGQPGWDQASADDPNRWNFGPAMWQVYAASRRLQDIFPSGHNRYSGADGGTAVTAASDLAMALEQAPVDFSQSAILVGAPSTATTVIVCTDVQAADCKAGATGAHATSLARTANGRAVFVTPDRLPMRDQLRLAAVAYDASGTLIAKRALVVSRAQ
jgi:V8-like Glu-specific endopeptidase